MVHRGRIQEFERASHPTGNMKHPRQFSTRSRAKSTASFKGLRRVLTHDTLSGMDRDHHPARIRSSESISRRRTLSGLNMTNLGLARSNPNFMGNGSGSHNHTFVVSSPGLRPRRSKSTHSVLQYGTDKDHIYNHIDNFASEEEVEYFTDEEGNPIMEDMDTIMPNIKENDISEGDKNDIRKVNSLHSPLSKKPEFTLGNDHELSHSAESSTDRDDVDKVSDISPKTTATEHQMEADETNSDDTIENTDNKVDSDNNAKQTVTDTKIDNSPSTDNIDSSESKNSNDLIIRKDSDDHIENSNLTDISSGNALDNTSNELTRQARNNELLKSNSTESENDKIINNLQKGNNETSIVEDRIKPDNAENVNPDYTLPKLKHPALEAEDNIPEVEDIIQTEDNNIASDNLIPSQTMSDKQQNTNAGYRQDNTNNINTIRDHNADMDEPIIKNSLTDQYIPNMILSQSTGMERTFEQPASIQNSLANELRRHKVNENTVETNNITNSFSNNNDGTGNINFARKPSLGPQQSSLRQTQNPKTMENSRIPAVQRSPQNIENRNKRNSFSNSYASLTNNLQRANAAVSLALAASAVNNPSKNKPKQVTLNNNIDSKPSSYISTIFNRRPASRESNLKANLRDPTDKVGGPSLLSQLSNNNNKGGSNGADVDDKLANFSQFLKPENIDGDSRTQRKLWLQRENSIMDLNLQNNTSADAMFMATNVDVKREFERISHEYTNLRRFYNPIDAALTRFESHKDHVPNVVGQTSTQSKIKTNGRRNTGDKEITQSLASGGDNMFNAFTSGRSVTSKNSDNNLKVDDFFGNTQNSKLQRILTTIWNQETVNFSNEVNPLGKNPNMMNGNNNPGLHAPGIRRF